ncbi:MAG: adenylate/guanylate cyclase domain-containing protein [Acidimicrobiales bacterium]|nr:adenylate/guanylate cyclase domain-containing protein [Acidimicrobiales bacterium]
MPGLGDGLGDARAKGVSAVGSVRLTLAERAADLLRRDPDLKATAVEVGLVDRAWLEEPGRHPVRTAPALDVVQRFLERSVERRPSTLGAIGLNALQLLAYDHPASAGDPAPSPVAIVFTDFEGFTRFTARHGDEAARSMLTDHHRLVGPLVRSRGGKVVKRLGDGLMLAFPSAEAAVHGALDLVDTPAELRLRGGVHCGEAVVTADDLIGHDVNIAARVAASARGGQVLATVAVREQAGTLRGVAFGRVRKKAFKGVGEAISVCSVRRVE